MKIELFAVTLLASGTLFADPPTKSVISVNICQGKTHVGHIDSSGKTEYETYAGTIPAKAWCCVDKTPNWANPPTIANYWNGDAQAVQSVPAPVTFQLNAPQCANYGYDTANDANNIYTPAYLRQWCAKKNLEAGDSSGSFTGVPFKKYSVVFYISGVASTTRDTSTESHAAFVPITVNNTSYTWDAEEGKAVEGTDTWGDCTAARDGFALGANTFVVNGLTGTSFTFAMKATAGGLAALQIVEEDDGGVVDPYEGLYPTDDVISINVCQGTGQSGHIALTADPLPTLAGYVPPAAWYDLDKLPKNIRNQGAQSVPAWWNASEQRAEPNAPATFYMNDYTSAEKGELANYGFNNDIQTAYLRQWASKKDGSEGDIEIRIDQIPYYKYSLIVYASGTTSKQRNGTDNKLFDPISVNGVLYTYDTEAGKTAPVAEGAEGTWGDCTYAQANTMPVEGQNALVIPGLVGPSVVLTNRAWAAGVAAIQIVAEDADKYLLVKEAMENRLAGVQTVPAYEGERTVMVQRLDGSTVEATGDAVQEDGTHVITFEPTLAAVSTWLDFSFNGKDDLTNHGGQNTFFNAPTVPAEPAEDAIFKTVDDYFETTREGGPTAIRTAACKDSYWGAEAGVTSYPGYTFMAYGVVPYPPKTIFASIGGKADGALMFVRGETTTEVRCVKICNKPNEETPGRTELVASFDVPDGRISRHLYAVTCLDSNKYTVYLDGRKVNDEPHEVPMGIKDVGKFISVGSIRAGVPENDQGYMPFDPSDSTNPAAALKESYVKKSVVDHARLYLRGLDDAAHAKLAEEFPYVKGQDFGFVMIVR